MLHPKPRQQEYYRQLKELREHLKPPLHWENEIQK
jgi:hypothetical protein